MPGTTMRDRFIQVVDKVLTERQDTVVVLADIGVSQFRAAGALDRHAERIINVGIREQLQVSFAAGLAKEGFKPIVHTYAPFLVERPFEQLKLDFGHQGLAGVFVSVGASFDSTASGRTHHAPEDVALVSTLPGWQIHVPGHPDEVEHALMMALRSERPAYVRLSEESNSAGREVSNGAMTVERRGADGAPVVIAVGPRLDAALEAVAGLDVTVLYATTVRPLDHTTLRRFAGTDVVLIEPYLAGTSASQVTAALPDRPHRLLCLGIKEPELRKYGTIAEHNAAHGLDAAGLRKSIEAFLAQATTRA
jgi:transketolase